MSPRKRKELDASTLRGRFGIHFQDLMRISGHTVESLTLWFVLDGIPVGEVWHPQIHAWEIRSAIRWK